jgi:putative membrane protein
LAFLVAALAAVRQPSGIFREHSIIDYHPGQGGYSMSAIVAFLHHLAFVVIMLTLAIEMVLLKQPMTLDNAKKIMRYDAVYGASAALILLFGALRVMMFEKGAAYYLHSGPFIAKMGLFIAVGLISIYPTAVFLKWRQPLKQGIVPNIGDALNRRLRILIHVELTLLALMLLSAALMAKGIGYFGS